MEDRLISETSPADWSYVAEGGATIVLAYNGPPHPDFNGTVLRARKAPVQPGDRDCKPDNGQDPNLDSEEVDDPIVVFQKEVIQRLVPSDALPLLRKIRVEHDWLTELAALVEKDRPKVRRQKDKIDVTRRRAVLATDLVGGNGWAIEIKPKWGFLPSPHHLSPQTRSVKTRTCRFCMHAHFKMIHDGHEPAGDFCPLDLYSGDKLRVTRAVLALWDGWVNSKGSANNLRVFVSGETIHPDNDDSINRLAALILPKGHALDTIILRQRFAASVVSALMQSSVLPTLSRLQRKLDVLDIEGLEKLWEAVHGDGISETALSFSAASGEPSLQEWRSFLEEYLAGHETMDHAHPDPAKLRYYTLAYLLSMSFKDCSIIVRPADGQIKASVSVIDLDAKSVKKLSQWAKLDRQIVTTYGTVGNKKLCADAHHQEIMTPSRSGVFLWTVSLLTLTVSRLAGSRRKPT
ncbi:hypothetical protein PUNSTDRAFT_104610 [Punctularia strigosozonata HHB-11173 SS5]|uniref:uncharacterized protein n=1 Tax=Punctularia strigosozonata (strain HHB-11173) TaxID=741275 RepID=UPI00044182AC|nr:uncharacterized protein PUNSTDRAFT_104610 [Punctularia strigosozonata HHB-11173 SS5]EIN07104.1 hypothetical protein PUNSTDRAFT_104610 [Punctularia strigosozonata HHB-11173 SS5]